MFYEKCKLYFKRSRRSFISRKITRIKSFAGGVRFSKSGGEAMAMAIRIARAASGRIKLFSLDTMVG